MTVTLELSGATLRWLQNEAEAKGTDASSIAEEQFALARARCSAIHFEGTVSFAGRLG
jgi:hypothetical protein